MSRYIHRSTWGIALREKQRRILAPLSKAHSKFHTNGVGKDSCNRVIEYGGPISLSRGVFFPTRAVHRTKSDSSWTKARTRSLWDWTWRRRTRVWNYSSGENVRKWKISREEFIVLEIRWKLCDQEERKRVERKKSIHWWGIGQLMRFVQLGFNDLARHGS